MNYFKMMAAATLVFAFSASAQTTVKLIQTPNAGIASAVWAGDTLYVSGQTATPITPADKEKGTTAVYGDTKIQAASVLGKIEALLKGRGLGMGDVAMMHVCMVGDPENGGKLDFAGMNAAYGQLFGTKDQLNKPARSTVQVAALAASGPLLEIEVIAVKSR